MSRPEIVQFAEHEARPAEGIRITLENTIAGRIKEVGFSIPEFHTWAQSRGLADPENHPLIINIKKRSERDIDGQPSSNGAFYMDSGISNIDLYIARRIGVYDLFQDKHDTEYREQVFNDALNRTFAHETEHYIETSNGNFLQDARGEYIVQEIIKYALQSEDRTPKTDEQVTLKILSLMERLNSAEMIDLYLEQPHEVRAREASKAHEQNHEPLIWLAINPPPKPKA